MILSSNEMNRIRRRPAVYSTLGSSKAHLGGAVPVQPSEILKTTQSSAERRPTTLGRANHYAVHTGARKNDFPSSKKPRRNHELIIFIFIMLMCGGCHSRTVEDALNYVESQMGLVNVFLTTFDKQTNSILAGLTKAEHVLADAASTIERATGLEAVKGLVPDLNDAQAILKETVRAHFKNVRTLGRHDSSLRKAVKSALGVVRLLVKNVPPYIEQTKQRNNAKQRQGWLADMEAAIESNAKAEEILILDEAQPLLEDADHPINLQECRDHLESAESDGAPHAGQVAQNIAARQMFDIMKADDEDEDALTESIQVDDNHTWSAAIARSRSRAMNKSSQRSSRSSTPRAVRHLHRDSSRSSRTSRTPRATGHRRFQIVQTEHDSSRRFPPFDPRRTSSHYKRVPSRKNPGRAPRSSSVQIPRRDIMDLKHYRRGSYDSRSHSRGPIRSHSRVVPSDSSGARRKPKEKKTRFRASSCPIGYKVKFRVAVGKQVDLKRNTHDRDLLPSITLNSYRKYLVIKSTGGWIIKEQDRNGLWQTIKIGKLLNDQVTNAIFLARDKSAGDGWKEIPL